jgi:hypothetical protein
MRFDLKDLNPGTWMDVDDAKPEEGALCLRVLNSETRSTLHKKHTSRKNVRGRIIEELDEAAFDSGMWDYCIMDWKGICDAAGKPIPCTKETKAKLMAQSPVFARLVAGLLEQLNAMSTEQAEDARKN